MQRINTPDGTFVDGDPFNNILGTLVTAAWLYSIQEEVARTIEGVGLALDATKDNQLLTAIETLIEARAGNYLLDTGNANAYVVVMDPPVEAYVNGLTVKFRAKQANTEASTLDAGGGPVALMRDDGSALQADDIAANAIVTATYDSPANAFLVNSIVMSQLGAVAKLGIGTGLQAISGDLTLKLASLLGFDPDGDLTINLGAGLKSDSSGKLATTGPIYLKASTEVAPGTYLVDTSAGGFTNTLPQSPSLGDTITFIDASNMWGSNNWALGANGNTIMGQSEDLTIDVSDQEFSIWFNGSDWRLV